MLSLNLKLTEPISAFVCVFSLSLKLLARTQLFSCHLYSTPTSILLLPFLLIPLYCNTDMKHEIHPYLNAYLLMLTIPFDTLSCDFGSTWQVRTVKTIYQPIVQQFISINTSLQWGGTVWFENDDVILRITK